MKLTSWTKVNCPFKTDQFTCKYSKQNLAEKLVSKAPRLICNFYKMKAVDESTQSAVH